MAVLRFVWKLIGIGVAIQFWYWAIMFTGAWLEWNAPPIVSPSWLALAFGAAAIFATEQVFPSLDERPDK